MFGSHATDLYASDLRFIGADVVILSIKCFATI